MKKAVLACALAAVFALGGIMTGCDNETADKNADADTKQEEEMPEQKPGEGEEEQKPGEGEEQKPSEGEEQKPSEGEEEERKLRVLDKDFKYGVAQKEYTVEYDGISIYGTLYRPKATGKFPLVILSHGFNGHYTDFPKECQRLAERGYFAYAFDYCGAQLNGKSTGRDASSYTPFTMKEDLIAVIKNLQTYPSVDPTQIFLFGGSQGGFITALTAADGEIKDMVSAIALYFPALNIPDDWRGKPERDTPLMGYSIGAEFIKSVQDLDPYQVIGGFETDVCIVWGDQDALVRREYIDRAMEVYGERCELTVIPGAGHGFGGEALNTAVETVLAFLEARTYES